jgi:hypothetical protein
MRISFDPAKRAEALRKRRIDFLDAERVFAGLTYTIPDQRFLYPEERFIAVGPHGDRGLDAHRGRPAHYFDEEGQCPRASALFTQTWLNWTPMKFSRRNTRIFRS